MGPLNIGLVPESMKWKVHLIGRHLYISEKINVRRSFYLEIISELYSVMEFEVQAFEFLII
jgi:hypothetical protein